MGKGLHPCPDKGNEKWFKLDTKMDIMNNTEWGDGEGCRVHLKAGTSKRNSDECVWVISTRTMPNTVANTWESCMIFKTRKQLDILF